MLINNLYPETFIVSHPSRNHVIRLRAQPSYGNHFMRRTLYSKISDPLKYRFRYCSVILPVY
jgi:hypothetical protein